MNKQGILLFLKECSGSIAVIILICLAVYLWQSKNSSQAKYEALKAQVDVVKSVEETQSQLNAMKKRQQELYPELQKAYSDLQATNQELDNKKKKLVAVKKEVLNAQIQKMDIYALHGMYSSLGYRNSVVSSGK